MFDINKFFLFFVSLVFMMACVNNIEEIKKITSTNDTLPNEAAKNTTILYSEYGNVLVKITAPVLNRYHGEKPYTEFEKGVHVWLFDSLNSVENEIICNYAIRYEKDKVMEGKGNVIVKNVNNEQLNTEYLVWDEKNDLIHTDKFVKITTPTEILMGYGLESNSTFTNYEIKKPEGVILIDDDASQQSVDTIAENNN